jgi:phage-related minor tail protein
MMNFGRAIGLFNRVTPKISKGIGQVANIARNVGQAIGNVRNIGSTVNAMSGGRIGSSPFGQKMQEITNKVESGANFIANNEDKAQGLINDVSRKFNA